MSTQSLSIQSVWSTLDRFTNLDLSDTLYIVQKPDGKNVLFTSFFHDKWAEKQIESTSYCCDGLITTEEDILKSLSSKGIRTIDSKVSSDILKKKVFTLYISHVHGPTFASVASGSVKSLNTYRGVQ